MFGHILSQRACRPENIPGQFFETKCLKTNFLSYDTSKGIKLYFFRSSQKGVKLPKIFGRKFWHEKLYEMPKNWLRRMFGVLRIVVLNFYRSISGITGHPVKNKNNVVLEFFIGCWILKSVCEYLVPFSNGSDKTGWVF